MAKKTFEQKLNSPFFKFSKRVFDLLALNIIFIVVSALSCLVLFFPGLISLHKITYDFVHNNDEPVYKTFFAEIKNQWSFGWRMTLCGLSTIAIIGALAYFDITYVTTIQYDWLGWVALVLLAAILLVLFTLFINLMLFNDYFKDDTFKMMIKKAALISLKKKWLSLLSVAIFICFAVVLFIVPYIIPFISFTAYIYIIQAINRKTFDEIARVEKERMEMPENLFLPAKVEEEE